MPATIRKLKIPEKKNLAKLADPNEQKDLRNLADIYLRFLDKYREKRQSTVQNYEFTKGESFDQALKAVLVAKGLPVVEISLVFPRILNVIGSFIANQTRLTASPKIDSTEDDAQIASKILEWANQDNIRNYEVIRAYIDAVIGDLPGALNVQWETDIDNPLGRPGVTRINPMQLILDPAADTLTRDKDHRFRGVSSWWDIDELVSKFPEKEQQIRNVTGTAMQKLNILSTWQTPLTDNWPSLTGQSEYLRSEFLWNKENKWLVNEIHTKRMEVQHFLINRENGDTSPGMTVQEAQAMSDSVPGLFRTVPREVPTMYTNIVLGDYVILKQFRRKLQDGMFPIVLFPGLEIGTNLGLVKNMKGAQRLYEQNITLSQVAQASSTLQGYTIERDSMSPDELRKFQEERTTPGYVGVVEPGAEHPKPLQSIPVDSHTLNSARLAEDAADKTIAVGATQLGLREDSTENATLNRQRVQQSDRNLLLILTNTKQAQIRMARQIIGLTQIHAEPGRLVHILGEENLPDNFQIPEDLNVNDFQIAITEDPRSETQREMNALQFSNFISLLPPEEIPKLYPFLVKYGIDVPDKQDILQALQSSQELPAGMQNQISEVVRQSELVE